MERKPTETGLLLGKGLDAPRLVRGYANSCKFGLGGRCEDTRSRELPFRNRYFVVDGGKFRRNQKFGSAQISDQMGSEWLLPNIIMPPIFQFQF